MLNLITSATPDECTFLNNDLFSTELCVPTGAPSHLSVSHGDLTMVLIIARSLQIL